MAKVYVSGVIDAPVDDVWAYARDFNGHGEWHPIIAESHIEEGCRATRSAACVISRPPMAGICANACSPSAISTGGSLTTSSSRRCRSKLCRDLWIEADHGGQPNLCRMDGGVRCCARRRGRYPSTGRAGHIRSRNRCARKGGPGPASLTPASVLNTLRYGREGAGSDLSRPKLASCCRASCARCRDNRRSGRGGSGCASAPSRIHVLLRAEAADTDRAALRRRAAADARSRSRLPRQASTARSSTEFSSRRFPGQ